MARRLSTGGVTEKDTGRGTSYGIRFRALGKRWFFMVGNSADGATRDDAERELTYVLEQVRRGEWRPPQEAEPPRQVPTFQLAASEWYEARCLEGGRSGK